MSHGERWIVPLNLLTIAVFGLVWATSLPLWSTCLIALPITLLLAFFGIDKYGGMQIVILVAPACLASTIGIASKHRYAVETNSELNIVPLVFQFVGTIVGSAVVLFAIMAALVGVAICWEWLTKKLGTGQIAIADEQSDPSKSPVDRDFNS